MTTALAKLWWLPALVGAGLVATLDRHGDAGDVIFFAHAGEALWGSGWVDVYADPVLQSGPLQLAVLGALSHLADGIGVIARLRARLRGRARRDGRHATRPQADHRPPRRALPRSWLAALVRGIASAYIDGHPAQLFIPLLWVLAGLALRRGEPVWAGVLVGLSAGLEVWGVLGVCVFAGAPAARSAVRGLASAVVVTGGLFAPFFVLGDFAMFEYSGRSPRERWSRSSSSRAPRIRGPCGYPGRRAVGAGAMVGWALRRCSSVIWAAPLVAVFVRLVFDPVFYAAYWLAPLTLAIIAALEFATGDLIRGARTTRIRHAAGSRSGRDPPIETGYAAGAPSSRVDSDRRRGPARARRRRDGVHGHSREEPRRARCPGLARPGRRSRRSRGAKEQAGRPARPSGSPAASGAGGEPDLRRAQRERRRARRAAEPGRRPRGPAPDRRPRRGRADPASALQPAKADARRVERMLGEFAAFVRLEAKPPRRSPTRTSRAS